MTVRIESGQFAAALEFCRTTLGEFTVVKDHSWPHGESKVLQIRDSRSRQWIVKSCRQLINYTQEVVAYREWVPALGDLAPRLVANDETTRTILMTFEPGAITAGSKPATHRQAGALIRKMHDSAPGRAAPDFGDQLRHRLDQGLATAPHLFDRRDVDFVREQISALDGLAPPVLVPAHEDNQPRNWLVGADGVVRLIDFGLSKWDVWVRDVVRLYYWDWKHQPQLAEAFFDGYGRRMGDEDLQVLRSIGAVTALMTVLWAHDHDDSEFARRGWAALDQARAEVGYRL
jgi:hypothetical protein